MGRWLSGDLDHKLWFGVQASDDADNFGVKGIDEVNDEGEVTGQLEYSFTKEHLDSINEGIVLCIKKLGGYKTLLDDFFKANGAYTEKDIAQSLKVAKETVKDLLVQYARLELGIQIRDCVLEKGECIFWAEC